MTSNISEYLMITVLTLCAFGAQSQIALEGVPVFPDSVEGGSCREHRVEMRQDTLHITPAMIEEMQLTLRAKSAQSQNRYHKVFANITCHKSIQNRQDTLLIRDLR